MRGRRAVIRATVVLVGGGALFAACTYEFEAFDPRLGTGAGTAPTGISPTGSGTGGGSPTGSGGGSPGICTPGQTADCYSGDPATQDVGLCHGGTMTCNDEGSGFGACEGEITPVAESCNTPYDDDCDGEVNEADASCECDPGDTTACYGGSPSTDGVGVCHAGEQMCEPSGTGYGPCVGQLLPSYEKCSTVGDDDCDGTANDHCATWSRRFNASDDDNAWGLAVDGSDNVLICGQVNNNIDFGGGTLYGGSNYDAFVAKFDSSGTHLWSKRYGDSAYQAAGDVEVDGSNNVYLGGYFAGTLDLGGGHSVTSSDAVDLFIAKLDSAGNALWIYSFGGAGDQWVESIDVDAAGNLVVTGGFENTLTFGTDVLSSFAAVDGYVAKFDTDGGYLWSLGFGEDFDDEGTRVEFDASGNVVLIGMFDERASFGGAELTDQGNRDVFVAKLDGSGGHLWSLAVGGTGLDIAWALGLDPSGNPVVGGEFNAGLDTPSQHYDTAGDDDMFVLKLDGSTGTEIWSRSYGGAGDEDLVALAVDANGNVMLGAGSHGPVDMGGGEMLPAGDNDDWILALLDSSGAFQYARRFGDPYDQDIRQVRADSGGNWLVAGEATGYIDLGNGLLSPGSADDIILGKFAP